MRLFVGSLGSVNTVETEVVAWLSGDPHSEADATEGSGTIISPTYEPIRTAVTQLKAVYPDLDFGVMVGDFFAAEGIHTQDDADAHANQMDVFDSNWLWENVFIFPGNHDGDSDLDISNYFRDYVDPQGNAPLTSFRDKANYNFDDYSDDSHYFSYARMGNLLVINIPDRNDLDNVSGKGAGSETGGFPAGTAGLDDWKQTCYLILSNPDLNVITSHHFCIKDTTFNTYDWARGKNPSLVEHRWQTSGNPIGRGRWQFMTDTSTNETLQAEFLHQRFFKGEQSNHFLHLGGHTHRKFTKDGQPYQDAHATKYNREFLNVGALSEYHGVSSTWWGEAKSWIMKMAGTVVDFEMYVHRADNSLGLSAGEHATAFDFSLTLPNTATKTHTPQTAVRPLSDATGLAAVNPTVNTIDLSWNESSVMLVRSKSTISWIPVDDTAYYPGQEVTTGVWIATAGEATSFQDFKLDPSTQYFYKCFAYGGGNSSMLWRTTSAEVNATTSAYTQLVQATLELPEIALDGLDDSTIATQTPQTENVYQITNLGSLGNLFQKGTEKQRPFIHPDGIIATGTSFLQDQGTTLDLATTSTVDIIMIHKTSGNNDASERHLFGFLGQVGLSQSQVWANGTGYGAITQSQDNGFVLDHIIIKNDIIILNRDGVDIVNTALPGSFTFQTAAANNILFTTNTSSTTLASPTYMKFFGVWESGISNVAAVRFYLRNFYGI